MQELWQRGEEKGHAVTVQREHSHGNQALANCSALRRAASPTPTELGVLLQEGVRTGSNTPHIPSDQASPLQCKASETHLP